MKKVLVFLSILGVATLFTISTTLFTGCTKEGPEGPPGKDGNATCGACHNVSSDVLAKVIQYENSGHATGLNFERSGTSCAPCHTHEGMMEVIETGLSETAEDVYDPTPPNCRTCHLIHTTYSVDDYDLTVTDAIEFMANGEVVDFGAGNVCVQCHQPRDGTLPTLGGDSVVVTSKRYGPHHGPQGSMVAGTAGYEIPGSIAYPSVGSHAHMNASCVDCHMAQPYGKQAGGHSLHMTYDYHGNDVENLVACEGCHSTITTFDHNNRMTEIQGLLDDLAAKLMAAGIMASDHYMIPGTYTSDQAGLQYNYKFVEEDLSLGVHNYAYAKALLQNSIDANI